MKKITLFLWFDGKAEEAMKFYTSVFSNSKPGNVNSMTAGFQLEGQDFIALNGGPMFKFTPATSFFVSCDTEQEIDGIWNKLSDGGMVLMPLNKYPFSEKFGWVQDKFGISWQLNLAHRAQKITPFLMFVGDQHGKAADAAKFYTSIFKNSGIEKMVPFGPGEQGAEGEIKHGVFSLNGQDFMVMDSNGPHQFSFSEAISFFVNCETQEEVDYYWEQLSAGGAPGRCGWLKDKYGVSWQIVPTALGKLMGDPDRTKANSVMQAMMKMNKIDIKGLYAAYDQP